MLRLTLIEQTPAEARIRLEGWLEGDGVEVLAAEIDRCLEGSQSLVLDVEGVRQIDLTDSQLLSKLRHPAVQLVGASPFIQIIIDSIRVVA